MARLDRVVITGADNSVSADSLAALSILYPFVEWGILVSKSNETSPRYPSRLWRDRLCDWTGQKDFNIAVHVQGEWLRKLLLGSSDELIRGVGLLANRAQRMQLNFHSAHQISHLHDFALGLFTYFGGKEIIFQHDLTYGRTIMAGLDTVGAQQLDTVPLYDTSHGAGVLPESWPQTEYGDRYVGYAGGLGPENLAEQIPKIAKAAGGARFWIDMETRVRTYEKFDLDKVQDALEICQPFIGKEI